MPVDNEKIVVFSINTAHLLHKEDCVNSVNVYIWSVTDYSVRNRHNCQ